MAASFIADLAALADPQRRVEGARALARSLGADDLVFFVRDVEIGAFLPAVGFPKTLPDGRAWQAFVREADRSTSLLARELSCPFTALPKRCLALAAEAGVAVLVGAGEASARLDELRAAMPLLLGLFRAERSLAAGEGHAEVARRTVQRAEALAGSLASSQAELHRVLRALHQSESWLSTTLRSIGDAVITTDASGNVSFMNPVAEALTGWAVSEATGTPLHELFHILNETTRAPVESLVDKVLRDGTTAGLANHTVLLRTDGTEVAIDDSAAPIRDANGVLIGVVLIFRDITERRATERTRAALVDELQRIVHANELFAGVLGHDLRNPLGSILMGAELLVRIDPDPRVQKTVERIIRSGHRMRRMIEQLLDFTRVRTGGALPLDKRTTNLAELCDQIVGELQAPHPEWTLRTDVAGDVVGLWDGDRLAQVLSNLVGNAIQHGLPSGGVHVRIDGTAPDGVVVEVHNEGAIPADVLPTIFDPFRTTRGLRDRSQGLGLGLFITREIVVAHHGEVEVTSTPATGTTFRLRLPRLAEAAAARC